jgi:hypothetical protein
MNERELCMPPRLASLTTILIEVAVDPYVKGSAFQTVTLRRQNLLFAAWDRISKIECSGRASC